jgi:hypothetical protein
VITLKFIDGVWAPAVICDICQGPINRRLYPDTPSGIVIWSMEVQAEGASMPELLYVHKGNCDLTAKVLYPGLTGWEALSHHLIYLCHNTGHSIADLDEIERSGVAEFR